MSAGGTAAGGAGKDLYKVLRVSRTATKLEIKEAYRKLALALHPDRNDGCDVKSAAFKEASEAYDTLSDHAKRTAYDNFGSGSGAAGAGAKQRRRPPPPNYRKVYSPKAPPGFKTFDPKRHFDMHYGDGMMRDEIDRVRKRAEAASGRLHGWEYQSPLGKGFEFEQGDEGGGGGGGFRGNPYSKRRQGPPPGGGLEIEYEEAHYYDLNSSDLAKAKRVVRSRETVKDRMQERRNNRVRERGQRQVRQRRREKEEGCTIM